MRLHSCSIWPQEDMIIGPNMPLWMMFESLKYSISEKPKIVLSKVITKLKEKLFVTESVSHLLWGYKSGLIDLLLTKGGEEINQMMEKGKYI